MTSVYERLKNLQNTLPGVPPPVVDGYVAAFVPFVRTGNVIYVSGRVAKKEGKPWTGKLGANITIEEGKQAARGVAALAVLGMTATLAGAQTDAVKEKPPLYTYESYWAFPPAHWGDVDKENATSNQKVLAPALADGTIVGYGDEENLVHPEQSFTHDNWWQAKSQLPVDMMKLIEAFHEAGGSSSPLLASSTQHWSQVYVSRFYNWKAGSWKGAYGLRLAYKLRPGTHPGDAMRLLSGSYVPTLEKLLADGAIVKYEIDRELVYSADSPGQIIFTFVAPSADGLKKFYAVLRAAFNENPLITPLKALMFLNEETPHVDWVRVNATYK